MKHFFVSYTMKNEDYSFCFGHCIFNTESNHFILQEFMDEMNKTKNCEAMSIISFQEISEETYEANK